MATILGKYKIIPDLPLADQAPTWVNLARDFRQPNRPYGPQTQSCPQVLYKGSKKPCTLQLSKNQGPFPDVITDNESLKSEPPE